jgi:hypothetical protein
MKLALFAALGLLACQHNRDVGADRTAALGTERADCRADKTCDSGLLCLSNLCVRPPPADCQLVADELASFDLGNYAEPEEREPVVAKYKQQCDKLYVSKEEGACLDKAHDRWGAAQCASRMFPELAGDDCTQIGDKTRASVARQYRNAGDAYKNYIESMATAAKQICTEEKWSADLTKCVLSAEPNSNVFSYNVCQAQLGQDNLQKLQTRYQQLLQQASR